MIKTILVIEAALLLIALIVWTVLAVLFVLGGGFDSPIHTVHFLMGLLIALVGSYVMICWVSDMARNWRCL